MDTYSNLPPAHSRARRSILLGLAVAAALGLGACQASSNPVPTLPSLAIPTFLASGATACIDAPTMVIIDKLRATGADTPAILAANKPALVTGLQRLQSSDATTTAWRDALVAAVNSDDAVNVALQVAKLSSGQVTVAPC
jgi:hypothetical protein